MKKFTVAGAGLAGTEAAWQIAQAGYPVTLVEMKPQKFRLLTKVNISQSLFAQTHSRRRASKVRQGF